MATTLIPLQTINVGGFKSFIDGGLKTSNTFAKIAGQFSKAPGVPDVPGLVKSQLAKHSDKLIVLAKITITLLVMKGMSEALQKLPFEQMINELNKLIEKINGIIEKVKQALEFLKTVFTPLFVFIGVLTVLYVVSKVITLIPSFGGGWGVVVVNTAIGQIAQTVMSISGAILTEVKTAPPAVLAAMAALLGVIAFINGLLNQLQNFLNLQAMLKNDYRTMTSNNASEMSDKGADNVEPEIDNKTANKLSSLNSGMSLGDNITERIGLSDQLNKLDAKLSGIGTTPSTYGDCTLPDGTVIQTTPEDCAAQGGVFGYGSPPTNPPSPPSSPYTDASGNVWCWEEPPGEWVCCGGTCFSEDLVACTLPSGEVEQLTREQCIAAGGTYPGYDRDGLNAYRNEIQKELDNMGGRVTEDELNELDPSLRDSISSLFDSLNDRIITSLLHPNSSVTIEDATKNFGTRYGFYQQEANEED
tara:strand:- start:190 stop:1608 length:1419 start_codon:yes stop_codon:yes gene_type:complete